MSPRDKNKKVKCSICGSKNQEGESPRQFMEKHSKEKPNHIEFESVLDNK